LTDSRRQMVLFAITPRILSCLQYVLEEGKEVIPASQKETYQSYLEKGLNHPIPLQVLNEVAEYSRKIGGDPKGSGIVEKTSKKTTTKSEEENQNNGEKKQYWFHELIEGSQPVEEEPPLDPTTMSPEEFEKETKRREIKKEVEDRAYQKMIANLTPKDQIRFVEAKEMKLIGRQGMVAFNILVSMVTLFACGWWLFSRAFDSQVTGVLGGLACAVAIMLVEVWLFIIRTNQIDNNVKKVQKKPRKKTIERVVIETYSTADIVLPSENPEDPEGTQEKEKPRSWFSSFSLWPTKNKQD